MKLISCKMPEAIIELIDQLVKEGQYKSRSELIRHALLELLKREGKL